MLNESVKTLTDGVLMHAECVLILTKSEILLIETVIMQPENLIMLI